MRDAYNWPTKVFVRKPFGLHALTTKGSNAEEEGDSRLPAPEMPLLTRMDRYDMGRELEKYFEFYGPARNGDYLQISFPERLVTNVLHDKESILPTCATVVTMSLVLPDGKLLATNGLDRELQTVFRIDPALLEYMPRPEDYTDDAIADAFEFLCDEWLIDVQADDTGKCILIAYTLSIIERVLLPERPGFL